MKHSKNIYIKNNFYQLLKKINAELKLKKKIKNEEILINHKKYSFKKKN